MSDHDWNAGSPSRWRSSSTARRSPSRTVRGQRVRDDSFLMLFNAHHEDLTFTLPDSSVRDDVGARARHRDTGAGGPGRAEGGHRGRCRSQLDDGAATCPLGLVRPVRPVSSRGRRTRTSPAPGKPVPAGTYRLRCGAEFDFDALAAQADYLAALGVTHAYLSPILQARPGLQPTATTSSTTRGSPRTSAARGVTPAAVTACGRGTRRRRRRRAPTTWRCRPRPGRTRTLVGAARGPRLAVRGVGRRRLVGAVPRPADAGPRPTDRRVHRRRERSRSTAPAPSRCCATTTTRFPCGPGPRTCRSRSSSTSSGTASPTGASQTRS
jgi:hypothetical protein